MPVEESPVSADHPADPHRAGGAAPSDRARRQDARRPDLASPGPVGSPDLVGRPVALLAGAVRRVPVVVVAVAVALTATFAVLAQRTTTAQGNEGMAPDNPEVAAYETLAERFGGTDDAVVQILVKDERGGLVGNDERGGLVGNDGLEAVTAIEDAVRASDAGPLLADRPDRPGVVSWLFPAQLALAGSPPAQLDGEAQLDGATVAAAYDETLAQLPEDQAGMAAALLPDGAEPSTADRGLILAFLDTEALPAGSDLTDQEALAEVESALAAAVRRAELPEGVSAHPFSMLLMFEDMDFDAEVGRLFTGAFAIIVLILAFVYWVRPDLGMSRVRAGRRSAADVLLSMSAIVMAVLWMQGLAGLLGPDGLDVIGPMSEFSQVIPVLLIGLGVDYAIHLTSRYREEVAAGGDVSRAIGGAVRTVGVALTLATATTAVGFLTNVVNPVPALRDFGILAAAGIVSAFLVMLTFVPAMRLLLDRRAERTGRLPAAALGQTSKRFLPGVMARTAVLARRASVPTLAVTLALAGLGIFGLTQLETRFSQTDMVPDDSPVLATMEEITADFDGGFAETTQVLVSGDVATAEVHNALVEAEASLADVDDVAVLGGRPAVQSPVTLVAELARPGPGGEPPAPPVAEAAADAGLREDLTVPAGADVAALYEAAREAAPEAAEQVLATDAGGRFDQARVAIRTTAGEEGAADLADALAGAVAPVESAGATAVATSEPIITEVIVEALRDSQVSSLLITLFAATVLLVATFAYERRRPMLGVVTIVPVVLVVLWTFGMMAATGIPFGPITATIAAVAIGIGLPYSIHVTHRFTEDRERYAEVGDAIASTVRHTGGAMAGSAFTTMAGFGILMSSSLVPFRQLGAVTVYAVGFAMAAATLVLPSMLVLWDRWHARRTARQAATAPAEQRELAGV